MSNAQELPGNSSPASNQVLEEEPFPCPFAGAHCQWKSALKSDVMDHLTKEHKSVATFQGEQIVFLATGIDYPGRVGWAMRLRCFDADFILILVKREDPHLFGFVQFIGSEKEADEFVYSLRLSGKDGISKTWETTPRSVHKGNGFAPDCLSLTEEETINFSIDAKLGVKVTITRKVSNDISKQLESLNLNDVETKKSEQEDTPSENLSSNVDSDIATVDFFVLEELMEAKAQVESENLQLKSKVEEAEKLIEEMKLTAFNKESEYSKTEGHNKKLFARIQSLEQQVKLENKLANKLRQAEIALSDANKASEVQIYTLTLRLQDAEKILSDMRKKVSNEAALKKENMDLITANEELERSNILLNTSVEELKDSLYASRRFYESEDARNQQRIQTLESYLGQANKQAQLMKENADAEAKCNEELKEEIKALNQKIGNMEQSHKSADELARSQQRTLTAAIEHLTDHLDKKSAALKMANSVKEDYRLRNEEMSHDFKELIITNRADRERFTDSLECQEVEGVLLRNQITCLKKDLEDAKAAAEREMKEMRMKLSAKSELLSRIEKKLNKEKEEKEELVQDGYEVVMF